MNLSGRMKFAILILAIVALSVSGFRIGHAKDGLSNSLGSASSGIVVYRTATDQPVGAKVIVKLDAPNKSPVLAIIRATSGNTADISFGTNALRVKKSQVYGKLIAVVPFIGSVLGVVGL